MIPRLRRGAIALCLAAAVALAGGFAHALDAGPGTKNFNVPPGVPDHFSNEAEPFAASPAAGGPVPRSTVSRGPRSTHVAARRGRVEHGRVAHGRVVHGQVGHGRVAHARVAHARVAHGRVAHGRVAHRPVAHGRAVASRTEHQGRAPVHTVRRAVQRHPGSHATTASRPHSAPAKRRG